MMEFDRLTVLCLVCGDNLTPEGMAPYAGSLTKHLKTHSPDMTPIRNMKDTAQLVSLPGKNGAFSYAYGVAYSDPHGTRVLQVTRVWGQA